MRQPNAGNPAAFDRRVLILALVLGAIAAGLIVAYLASQGSDTEETVQSVSVVVASRDIQAGQEIAGDDLSTRDLPETAIAAGAIKTKNDVIGEVARYPIAKGEQIVPSRLVSAPEVQALSFQIPKGMRAFTLPVSQNNTPAALLAPGDFVDVIVAAEVRFLVPATPVPAGAPTPTSGNNDFQAAVTLLQNVQVLAVARAYVENGVTYDASVRGEPPDDKDIRFVTIAVTPAQAQILWLATQDGKATLTLRAFGDDEVVTLPVVVEPVTLP